MRPPPLLLLALAALAALASAFPAAAQGLSDPQPVQARFEASPAEVSPGGTVLLRVVLDVEAGWHVYATATPNGDPTKVALTLPPGLTLDGPLSEPAAHEEELEYVGPVRTHAGAVVFAQRVRVAPDARGRLTVPARVTWQACDDANTMCLTGEAQGELAVSVVPGAPAAEPAPPAATLPPADLPPSSGEPSAWSAWGPEASAAPGAAPVHVTARARLAPARAAPGALTTLEVEVQSAPGWHVYATETPNGEPTKLTLRLPPGLTVEGPLAEPPPHAEEVEFVGPVRIHRGTITLHQRLRVAADAAGALALEARVGWLACDDANTACIPGEHAISLRLEVPGAQGAPPAAPAGPAVPAGPAAPPGPAAAPAPPAEGGLLKLALASIVLGLLMLAQPCTYPMIPITVSIFSKGKALSRPVAALRAGVYAAGIIVSFVLVGALIQVLFGASGQGRLTQFATNAWVNLAIGLIFLYFAFSFFGYYEVGLPGPLRDLMQLGQARRDDSGTVPTWSLFLMGFFFVLTSYTCGAPIVLALFTGSLANPHPGAVVWATFWFALTVAVPFFCLSLVPGAVRSLPRSGSWFSVFKAAIGFAELGFALKFLRGADVMWDLGLLTRPLLLGLWTALAAVTALYLVGRLPWRFPHDPELREPSTGRGFFAALFVVAAVYFASGLRGRPLHDDLEAFMLTTHQREGDAVTFGPAPPEGQKDIRLAYRVDRAYLDEAQARAKRTGKPAFVMFTGHNCVNCQRMEGAVLPRPEVIERLEDLPRVALFTDKGEEEAKNQALMQERFQTAILPSFFLIDGEGRVLSAQHGGSSAEAFVEFLDRGLGRKAP